MANLSESVVVCPRCRVAVAADNLEHDLCPRCRRAITAEFEFVESLKAKAVRESSERLRGKMRK